MGTDPKFLAAMETLNKIEDYFEYRYAYVSQTENREYVLTMLDALTGKLERMPTPTPTPPRRGER